MHSILTIQYKYGHPDTPTTQHPCRAVLLQYSKPTRRFRFPLPPISLPFIPGGSSFFLFPFFPFFPFLFSLSSFFFFLFFLRHRVWLQLCLDIDRLFPFFWPPQPVFGVLSHGRRQTVRRLWPPESSSFLSISLLSAAFSVIDHSWRLPWMALLASAL